MEYLPEQIVVHDNEPKAACWPQQEFNVINDFRYYFLLLVSQLELLGVEKNERANTRSKWFFWEFLRRTRSMRMCGRGCV